MPKGWRKNGRRVKAGALAGPAVAEVVRIAGGRELRIYASYAAAVAAGMPAPAARAVFRRRGGCGGSCWTTFSQDTEWVWCEDKDCVNEDCACHLFETWKDDCGSHDESRGNPGEGWQYKTKPHRFYSCRCTYVPSA